MTADNDYSPLVVELFDRRPHAGRMPADPDVHEGRAGDAARGIDVQFWLKCAHGRIQATSFLAYGCPHTIAAASWLAQRVRGMAAEEAQAVGWRDMEQALAVPSQKRGHLLVIEDAFRAALKGIPDWGQQEMGE